MQVKTTIDITSYPLGRMVSKIMKLTSIGEDVKKLNSDTCWWECKIFWVYTQMK